MVNCGALASQTLTNAKCDFWHLRFPGNTFGAPLDGAHAAQMTLAKSVYLLNQDYLFGQTLQRETKEQLPWIVARLRDRRRRFRCGMGKEGLLILYRQDQDTGLQGLDRRELATGAQSDVANFSGFERLPICSTSALKHVAAGRPQDRSGGRGGDPEGRLNRSAESAIALKAQRRKADPLGHEYMMRAEDHFN